MNPSKRPKKESKGPYFHPKYEGLDSSCSQSEQVSLRYFKFIIEEGNDTSFFRSTFVLPYPKDEIKESFWSYVKCLGDDGHLSQTFVEFLELFYTDLGTFIPLPEIHTERLNEIIFTMDDFDPEETGDTQYWEERVRDERENLENEFLTRIYEHFPEFEE